MSLIEVHDADFQNTLTNNKIVLVDFWAAWCGPCKMLLPKLENISQKYEGKVSICKMNIEESSQTPQAFGVQSIPTMILFKDGEKVGELLGNLSEEKIEEALDELL